MRLSIVNLYLELNIYNYKTNWFYSKNRQLHRIYFDKNSTVPNKLYDDYYWYVTNNAHFWTETLPLKDKTLICRECNVKTLIGLFNIKRCKRHTEKIL